MKKCFQLLMIILVFTSCSSPESKKTVDLPKNGPIQLHPDNPHYFLYKGEALALLTSAEHYGAVLNLEFDYAKYLNTLANDGMNYTRIFAGPYHEIYGESFGIQKNTLAPKSDKLTTPWVKLDSAKKYDLTKWNEAFFTRLKDFFSIAAEKNIIVEVTLFTSIYRDEHWDLSPLNPENNINISHAVNRLDAQTMNNGDLLLHQENYVRKIITELNEFDNFFFEIQNEPWSDRTVPVYNIINKEDLISGDWSFKSDFADKKSLDWQEHMAKLIKNTEKNMDKQHLVAQNYANFRASIPFVSEHIDIINFHYAWPEAAEWNYHYNRVLGFDESGFAGSDDLVYRRQAWQFMLSGGGLFNNLDYSFFIGNEDGLGINQAPGGGSKTLRQQLKILSDFLHSLPLEKMKPDKSFILSSPGLIPYSLSDAKEVYAIYLRATGTENSRLQLKLKDGDYQVSILNTINGKITDLATQKPVNGIIAIDIDIPDGEIALKIVRK